MPTDQLAEQANARVGTLYTFFGWYVLVFALVVGVVEYVIPNGWLLVERHAALCLFLWFGLPFVIVFHGQWLAWRPWHRAMRGEE